MREDFNNFLNTFGLLVLWLAEMVTNRRLKPLDIFLYDQGYTYMGYGIWEKK
jgi:hypothetical protein